MIQIIKKEDEQRQLQVTVEIPEERAQKKMRDVARKLGRELRFPGFRPGKAPYPVVVGRFGEDALRAEALEGMVDEVFAEVREELEEQPYLPAELVKMELNPMQISFVFPLPPKVTLGEYRDMRQEVPPVTVSEEDIASILQNIRGQHSIVETVERPADFEDLVTVNGTGYILNEAGEPDEQVLEAENQDLILDNNQLVFGGEFVMHLIGISEGEEKTFRVMLPDNFPKKEYAGKLAEFNLTVTAVKQRELPELDDELAQAYGDYETLDELRQALRADMLDYREQQARSARLDQVVADIRASATIIYPPAAVKQETDDIIKELQEQVKRSGMEWEEYVATLHETEAALRDSLKENSVKRLEERLILQQFVEDERLKVKRKEIEARAHRRLKGVTAEMQGYLLEFLTKGRGAESIINELIMDKIHERIEAILRGVAPDLAELQAATDEEE